MCSLIFWGVNKRGRHKQNDEVGTIRGGWKWHGEDEKMTGYFGNCKKQQKFFFGWSYQRRQNWDCTPVKSIQQLLSVNLWLECHFQWVLLSQNCVSILTKNVVFMVCLKSTSCHKNKHVLKLKMKPGHLENCFANPNGFLKKPHFGFELFDRDSFK